MKEDDKMKYITPETQKMYAEIQRLLMYLCFIIIVSIPAMVYRKKIKEKNKNVKVFVEEASKKDSVWDIDALEERITEIYYSLPNIVKERNITALSKYGSERFLDSYRIRFHWQIYRKETEILKHIDLYHIDILQLKDLENNNEDYAWFNVQGERISYCVDENGIIVKGEDKAYEFKEYWKMIRIKDCFYVDTIKSEVEMNIEQFND